MTALVVGGGIAGLMAAALLKRTNDRVILVDREDSCGGLLRSVANQDGISFDFGTHSIAGTGVPDLDRELLSVMDDDWNCFEANKIGTYFNGRLNHDSPYISALGLQPELYRRGLAELLSAVPPERPANLEAELLGRFGPTFTSAIHRPVLRKLLDADPAALAPGAHNIFALGRLIVETPEETRRLKLDPALDARIAYHSYKEVPSAARSYYPKKGGIGLWAERMTDKLKRDGVELLLGETVDSLTIKNGRVSAVRLSKAGEIAIDRLIWTVPLFQFFKAAGRPCPGKPPALRTSALTHLIFDKPFPTDLNYVTCYDPAMRSFRATIYPNILGRSGQPPYNCTVEAFCGPGENARALCEGIPEELKQIGLVSEDARILYRNFETVREGFPVRTPEFAASAASQREAATSAASNAVFLGKASGSAFFQAEVLRETYAAISAPTESRP